MNNRGALGVLAAVLLFGTGVRLSQPIYGGNETAGGGNSKVLGNSGAKTCAKCSGSTEGPWKAACEVFALNPPQVTWTPPAPIAPEWGCVPPAVPLRFLIATVPDPKLTHLALYFDRGVESILAASEAAGYTLERFWIPWTSEPEPDLLLLADRERHKKELEERYKRPGLLVMRRAPDVKSEVQKEPLLFVFLLGETPTTGVNKDALGDAVRTILALRPDASQLSIAGPAYSGSLAELARDLAQLQSPVRPFSVRVASGTATSQPAIETARALIGQLGHGSEFDSLIENDNRALCSFLKYVGDRWRQPKPIGMISESGTVYGDIPSTCPSNHSALLSIHYPREIARLRNAYQEETVVNSAAKQPIAVAEGVKLTLKDGDAEPAADRIAAFSPLQSPASQQAVLAAISTTLRRERVEMTGVVATDILDSVFLDRYFHLSAPDTRLFMLDADLLLSPEVESVSLTGLLSVTSYPLFNRNQSWTNAPSGDVAARAQFASQYSEGVYNAVGFLLPDAARRSVLLDYARPGEKAPQPYPRPALWLTVLGRDSYWPVALLDDNDQATGITPAPRAVNVEAALHPESPSFSWYLGFWSVLIWSALHCIYWQVVLAIRSRKRPQAVVDSYTWLEFLFDMQHWLSNVFPAYPTREPTFNEKPFLVSGSLALFGALVQFASVGVRFAPSMPQMYFYGALSLVVLAGLILTACQFTRTKRSYYVITAQAWMLTLAFSAAWIGWCWSPGYRSGYFFAYRSMALTSGVSPVIPMLLLIAAIYCWAWVHLKRQSKVNDRYEFLKECAPVLESNQGRSQKEAREFINNIDKALNEVGSPEVMWRAGVFFILWFVLFTPWRHAVSVEHKTYNWAYSLMLGEVYWIMSLTWVQFMRSWSQFKVFLEWLENHPVRGAFSRLQGKVAWVPLVAKMPGQLLLISNRCRDCLQALICFAEPGLDPLRAGELSSLKERLLVLSETITTGIGVVQKNADDPHSGISYNQLQAGFERARVLIMADLEENAWTAGSSDSLSAALEPDPAKHRQPDAEEQMTILEEEFVALRLLMFMRYVFRQLRNLLGFVAAVFILSVISLNAYPFQAHRWIDLSSLIIFGALGTGVVIVFAQMDRDAILSRITKTNANELNRTFFVRTAQFGALPLLTLLASQFPSISHYIFSWAQPALEALR